MTLSQLQPIIQEAIAGWAAVLPGVSRDALEHVHFEITHLQGPYLGITSGNTILIDATADGFGWFVDGDPADGAFTGGPGPFEETAAAGSAAAGHMDLLTVVMHEMGHLLGLDDMAPSTQPVQVMTDVLAAGTRLRPDAEVVARDRVFVSLGSEPR
jgi:hypothetical protein